MSVVLMVCLMTIGSVKAATVTALATGNWNAAGTWDTGVPAAGDDVIIPATFTVTLDIAASVKTLTVAGTLQSQTALFIYGYRLNY